MSTLAAQNLRTWTMEHRSFRTILLIAVDLALLLLCLSHLPSIVDRARSPVTLDDIGTRTVVTSVEGTQAQALIEPGDVLIAWNDIRIGRPEHAELLADRERIGATVVLAYERDGIPLTAPVQLVAFAASSRFALVYAVIGIVVFSLALFVVLKRPHDPSAIALHHALVALGALVLLTQGSIDPEDPLSYVHRAGLFTSYPLVAAFFVRWTLMFPVVRWPGRRWPHRLLMAIAFFFALTLSSFHLAAIADGAPEPFDLFQDWYAWFHLVFAVLVFTGIAFLAVGAAQEGDPDRRAALSWILWGMFVGAVPYTTLIVLPQVFGPTLIVAEELAAALSLAIPISLTVAFLRYRVFDLQVDVYRRLASRVVAAVTGSLAVLASLLLVSVVWDDRVFDDHLAVALAVGLAMLLLQSARTVLGRTLEASLQPARGALAQVLQRAGERFHSAMTTTQLGIACVHELTVTIPGIDVRWGRVAQPGGFELMEFPTVRPEVVRLPEFVSATLRPRAVLAVDGTLHRRMTAAGLEVQRWLRSIEADLIVGLHDGSGQLLGAVLGRRGERQEPLSMDEVQALLSIVTLASETLGRLHVQEQIILEQEKRRLMSDQQRLRSRFVSSVSHDLRTPLTSIAMFAEMLRERRLSSKRRREYSAIIMRESQRLERMVNNVLTFARIEQGTRAYARAEVDLRSVLQAAVATMDAQAEARGVALTLRAASRLPNLNGDADALQDVLHNLIGNALQYGSGRGRVRVEASASKGTVTIRVRDNGVGIAPEHLPRIFDAFYRIEDPRTAASGGAGLGLAVVKHIVEAHGGTIGVESTPGKGTTVTVALPSP